MPILSPSPLLVQLAGTSLICVIPFCFSCWVLRLPLAYTCHSLGILVARTHPSHDQVAKSGKVSLSFVAWEVQQVWLWLSCCFVLAFRPFIVVPADSIRETF